MLNFRLRSVASLALAAGLAASSWTPLHAEGPGLALAERRALKQYQDTKFPEEQKKIQAGAGFDVALEVKWDAIARPGDGSNYLQDDYWTNIFFEPLAAALKQVAADDMGAKALKEKLKKIVVTYDEKTAPASNYPNGVTFDNGTLTINFTPFSNAQDKDERTKAIAGVLESKL